MYRRAEFWDPDTCTLLDIANVLGRWESASEWRERTEFAVAKAKRKEDMALGATKGRYDMAQRMGVVERVALQQNVAKLPFTNAQLAASFGMSTDDFNAMPLSSGAINVVFDALSESKSGLLDLEVCDRRRRLFFTPDGALDEGAIAAGLYKSRALVLFSWLFYGKGRIYGFAVFVKLVIDKLDIKEQLGEFGPYVDLLLFVGAGFFAVQGVWNQGAVQAATKGYETVSAKEAEDAALAADADGSGYSTVFEKMSARKKGNGGASAEMPIVPVAIMLGGLLSINVLGH